MARHITGNAHHLYAPYPTSAFNLMTARSGDEGEECPDRFCYSTCLTAAFNGGALGQLSQPTIQISMGTDHERLMLETWQAGDSNRQTIDGEEGGGARRGQGVKLLSAQHVGAKRSRRTR